MTLKKNIKQMFETNSKELNKFSRTIYDPLPSIKTFLAKGDIYFIGAGKSGIVANLLSSYFRSVGIKAHSLNPIDALHGDIGVLGKNDKCICISHTGETQEIIDFVKYAKKKKANTLLFTSNLDTKIEADIIVYSGIKKESVSFSRIPTTSILASVIFGHILLEAIIDVRGIKEQSFFENHPNGGISKRYKGGIDEI